MEVLNGFNEDKCINGSYFEKVYNVLGLIFFIIIGYLFFMIVKY